jgi:hypothetical protein
MDAGIKINFAPHSVGMTKVSASMTVTLNNDFTNDNKSNNKF